MNSERIHTHHDSVKRLGPLFGRLSAGLDDAQARFSEKDLARVLELTTAVNEASRTAAAELRHFPAAR